MGFSDVAPATVEISAPPGTIDSPPRSRRHHAMWVLVAVCGAVGVVLRFWPRPAIWLDEAQSLAFASTPLTEIPGALREDGAPPLYYLLLHGWMRLVGDGDDAVRLLSSLLSVATLVVLAVTVRRRWGTALAVVATVLLATNPFAIRYATHARMYSLVMLEVVVGLAFVARALERPRVGRLAAVMLVAAALLYTHYWSIYLLATAAVMLWVAGRHGDATTRRARRLVAIAIAAGFVLWIPWVPTFVFQARHTATPWAPPATAASALEVLIPTVEGPSAVGIVIGIVLGVCFLFGLRARDPRQALEVGWVGAAGAITVCMAVAGAIVSVSAVSGRYFAVAVPLIVLAAAAGALRLPAGRHLVIAVLSIGGLWLASEEVVAPRTTADAVAAKIMAGARPGDVVVTCPDQLSPALHRILESSPVPLDETSFPPGSTPRRVNWIDYADRARLAMPAAEAQRLVSTYRDHTIWFVVSTTYPPTESACRRLLYALRGSADVGRLLRADQPNIVEHGALWRFDLGST